MIHKRIISVLLSAMTVSATAVTLSTERITTDVNQGDSSRIYDIDEIVITSQPKDVFKLRQQPLSSSSFSSTEIANLGMRDLHDVSSYVPSFIMPSYGARYTSSIYVRGFGSRINNPAVGIYVDDIPLMSKSAYNSHFFDILRIDVLRGPQGTLYGQNTEGGLIRIYSKSPLSYKGTDIKASFGSYFMRNVEFGHYDKIDETMAYSIAGFYEGQNGFLKNSCTGEHADLSNEAGGRFRFFFTPNSSFTASVTTDYQHVRQNAFAYGQLDTNAGHTNDPSSNFQNHYQRDMLTTGINLQYKGKTLDIHSTTSYQYLHDNILMDQDYTDMDYMHLQQKQIQNSATEEFTIKNNNASFWNWMFGTAINYQWLRTNAPVYFGDGMTSQIASGIQRSIRAGIIKSMTDKGLPENVAIGIVDNAGGVNVDLSMQVPGIFHTPQLNLGVFHESNLNITPRLTATLGVRYDFNSVKAEYDTEAEMKLKASVMGISSISKITSRLNHDASNSFSQILPKIALSCKVGKDNIVYALVSKGYRAGGYNIQMFSDILQSELNANAKNAIRGDYDITHSDEDYKNVNTTISYKPETSWNYETGAHINMFGNSVHADLSAFYMNVSNQQLSVMAGQYGFGRMMVNAGKSRSFGIEATLNGRALNNRLGWSVSYGFTNATFREYSDSVKVDGKYVMTDYKNKHIPYTPTHTIGASADYRIDFNNIKLQSLTIGLSATGQGRTYWNEANSFGQDFYALLNAHADADFGTVKISLWGKNLTDTRYNTFAIESSATGTSKCFAQRGMPIQVGIDMNLHF